MIVEVIGVTRVAVMSIVSVVVVVVDSPSYVIFPVWCVWLSCRHWDVVPSWIVFGVAWMVVVMTHPVVSVVVVIYF